jgi:hypothetical protein
MAGLVGLLVARFVPLGRIPGWGCHWRKLTGWPCPGCGLTRAADRFAHGDLPGAFSANPLGALAAALFAAAAGWMVLHLVFRLPVFEVVLSPREQKVLRTALVSALVLNYGFVILQTRFPGWR